MASAICLIVVGRRFNAYPGQREWFFSCLLFVGSLLSITLRLHDIFLASVLLGNCFQFLGYYFLALGTLRFLGQDYTEHWVAGVFLFFLLGLMGTLAMEANFLNARLAVVSFIAATFSIGIAFFINNFSQHLYRYEKITEYAFLFHGAFSIAKGILTLIDHDRDSLFSPTLISQLTFLEYLGITILWAITLNLLGAQRIKHDQNLEKLRNTASATK